jgi:zinc transporter ZupT
MSEEVIFANPELPSNDATVTTQNLGVALGMVILSGGATSIGAAVVYIPSLVNLANNKTLAISLGLSTGVMLFVSFVEIFGKSQKSFKEAGFEPDIAFVLAMVAFFAGTILMLVSHYAMDKLLGGHAHEVRSSVPKSIRTESTDDVETPAQGPLATEDDDDYKEETDSTCDLHESSGEHEPNCHHPDLPDDSSWGAMMIPCCVSTKKKNVPRQLIYQANHHEIPPSNSQDDASNNEDKLTKLNKLHQMAKEMKDFEEKKKERDICLMSGIPEAVVHANQHFEGLQELEQQRQERDCMMPMSYKTAFAIALHNFPEGLATFVATLGDAKMGLVMAIGIAIHNIPEGLAVALPLYYATGNRTKAFLVASLSGFTEVVAALLGWAVLATAFSPTLYAVVFGIVSGMMVLISVRELMPTAHKHDPDDKYVTISIVVGMMVMALSLALIALV